MTGKPPGRRTGGPPREGEATASPRAHPKLLLTPSWAARVENAAQGCDARAEPTRVVPRAPEPYAAKVTFVEDRPGAEAMLDFARQRPISYAGYDCEFRFNRPIVPIRKNHSWSDPRSVVPLLMAVTLVEVRGDGGAAPYTFVIDLRRAGVLDPLAQMLRQPAPFVAHYLRSELFCLWMLGLPTPDTVWDTCIAERAFLLGQHHARYKAAKPVDDVELARLREEVEEDVDFSCSLLASCGRRGVPHAFANAKNRLRESFLAHPDDAPFSAEQREYVAADAAAAARLYPIQVQHAVAMNALDHLKAVEMPWGVTNAAMVWEGVRVDPGLCEAAAAACVRHDATLSMQLGTLGINNVNSPLDLKEFFRTVGLLDALRKDGGYTFDDGHLEVVEDRHPAIPMIRAARKIKRLRADRLLSGELVGADGRLHPDHRQLGTESGRNAMRDPNVGGVGRALRPLVVPGDPAGWGIGEVDLSQIEVLIAAAESGDPDLIAMVNGRDVYCAMARGFYADTQSPEALRLPDKEFGKEFKHLRDRMKILTLAIIYNITRFGLARQLGISLHRAAGEQAKFLAMFPVLDRALREMSAYGAIRGYAELRTGLRRYRAGSGRPSAWEVNWLRNTPIQGSASVVFKVAGNRLHRRYQHYDARLILALHDAYVFECPLLHLEVVARITAEVMIGAVQEYYPVLEPRVDVNIEQPHCWNKDGKASSLERWLEDLDLARDHLRA